MNLMSTDFYAYWNAQSVSELFNCIAAMTATDNYRQLLAFAVLFGFLAVMVASAVRNKGVDVIFWSMTTFVIFMLLYVPKMSINVIDVRSHHVRVVSGVPIGLGFPAATLSQISWFLTTNFETAFQDVDAAKFSRFGLAFPQRVVMSVFSAGPVTPEGRELLFNFAERCVVPEIIENEGKRAQIQSSPNIWGTVTSANWVNPARRIESDGRIMTCKQAAVHLEEVISNIELPKIEKILGAKLQIPTDSLINASLRKELPGAEALMLGLSDSLSTSLKHALFLNTLPEALSNVAENNSANQPIALAVRMSKSQGNLASEINYRTLSEMAESALPKIRNLLEFIIIGTYPIVFVMVLAMGTSCLNVLRSWITLFLSVSLWAPISALINYLSIHVDAEPLNRLVAEFGGVTLLAADTIRDLGASSQAMAGSLMWAVPVMAYALAKGSDMAVTSMVNGVLSPASHAAGALSSNLAMGNASVGNASINNTSVNNASGNKQDFSSQLTADYQSRVNVPEGNFTQNSLTGKTTQVNLAMSNIGVTASEAWSNTNSYNSSVNHADSTSQNDQSVISSSLSSASSSSIRAGMSDETTLSKARSSENSHARSTNRMNSETSGCGSNVQINDQSTNTDAFAFETKLGGNFNHGSSSDGVVLAETYGQNHGSHVPIQLPASNFISNAKNNASHNLSSGVLDADQSTTFIGGQGKGTSSTNVQQSTQVSMSAGKNEQFTKQRADSTGSIEKSLYSDGDAFRTNFTTDSQANIARTTGSSNNESWIKQSSSAKQTTTSNNTQAGSSANVIANAALVAAINHKYQSPLEALEDFSSNTNATSDIANSIQSKNSKQELDERTFTRPKEGDSAVMEAYEQNSVSNVSSMVDKYEGGRARWKSDHTSPAPLKDHPENADRQYYVELGALKLTSDRYRAEHVGVGSTLSRSFLSGLTYRTPDELKDQIMRLANDNEGFRNHLERIGRGD